MSLRDHRRAALALLRLTLLGVVFVCEQLVDARELADSGFFVVFGIAVAYAIAALIISVRGSARVTERFAPLQPGFDVLLMSGLAYTSGGAFSDVRKAFFVIPLAAAFSERPRSTASWSLLAVAAFTFLSVVAAGHPPGSLNTWQRMTVNQDLYLAWTGAAATLLAVGLRRRTAHIEELALSRQRLVTQAIESVERERTRLAGALHDSPVQNLIAARHDLRRAERTGDKASFVRLHEAIDATIQELREEIFKLYPHVLDHVGLSAALEQVARHHARDSELEITVAIDVEDDLMHRQVLFALGRELLGNAAKHAGATKIGLRLRRQGAASVLEVQDDGCGIPEGRMREALLAGHVGLAAVRERVEVLGGTVTISTALGRGTTVRIVLPPAAGSFGPRAGISHRVTPLEVPRVSPA